MAYNFKIAGATRYVSKSGNDSWDGSRDFPKATIGGAITGTTNNSSTIIVVGTGVYKEVYNQGSRSIYGDGLVTVRGNGSNSITTVGETRDLNFENLLSIPFNGTSVFTRCTFAGVNLGSGSIVSGQPMQAHCKFINCTSTTVAGSDTAGIRYQNCDFLNCDIKGAVQVQSCYMNSATLIGLRLSSTNPSTNNNVMGAFSVVAASTITTGVIQDVNGNYYDLSLAGTGGTGTIGDPFYRGNTANSYFDFANHSIAYTANNGNSFNKPPGFNNSSYLDLTLQPNSPHINAGFTGNNIGSSVIGRPFYAGITDELLTANGATISNLSGTTDLEVASGTDGYITSAPIFNSVNPQAVALMYLGFLGFNKSETGGTAENTNVPDATLHTNIIKSATTTNTSTTVTVDTTDLVVGMSVYGTGIPVNTSIASIGSGTITISNAATTSATNNLTFVPQGNNPDRLCFLCRWTNADTEPADDSEWTNSGLFTAGEFQPFVFSLNANEITYMSRDSAGRTNGNPAFDWSTAMDLGITYYQVKVVLRDNYTN